jgi:hypothetical protein
MKVDNEQENAYMDTENFGKDSWPACKKWRYHRMDLWSLQPGGEDQGYQYLTVQIFTDPVKWCRAEVIYMLLLKKHTPICLTRTLWKKFEQSAKSRDLAARFYLEQIDVTKDHLTCR